MDVTISSSRWTTSQNIKWCLNSLIIDFGWSVPVLLQLLAVKLLKVAPRKHYLGLTRPNAQLSFIPPQLPCWPMQSVVFFFVFVLVFDFDFVFVFQLIKPCLLSWYSKQSPGSIGIIWVWGAAQLFLISLQFRNPPLVLSLSFSWSCHVSSPAPVKASSGSEVQPNCSWFPSNLETRSHRSMHSLVFVFVSVSQADAVSLVLSFSLYYSWSAGTS